MSRQRGNLLTRCRLLSRFTVLLGLLAAASLAGCAETRFVVHTAKRLEAATGGGAGGIYKVGNPYQVKGVWYYPKVDYGYDETGIASWYGAEFHGRRTANGETYDMNSLTAAHKTLPMPSFVRVTNLENGRSLVVRVNDRGPYVNNRIIDLSRRAAQLLGMMKQGTAKVRVQILADRSRVIAARMQAGLELAKSGSPITVDRLPKEQVSSESLAPPSGASAAPAKPEAAPAKTAAAPAKAAEAPSETAAIRPPGPKDQIVTQEPVEPTKLFIQVGAFTVYQNALRMQAALSPITEAFILHRLINGQDFYRVRIGPLGSVDDADRMLERVAQAGYPAARIVVD